MIPDGALDLLVPKPTPPGTRFEWATITAAGPQFQILLDTDRQPDGTGPPLPYTPDSLVDPLTLTVGDRVLVELGQRRVIVHGASGGAGGSVQTSQTVPIGGTTMEAVYSRSGRMANLYSTVVTASAISTTPGTVMWSLLAGWAPRTSKYVYVQPDLNQTYIFSLQTNGLMVAAGTYNIPAGRRITFDCTYLLP